MTRSIAVPKPKLILSFAASLALALGLGACTVYDSGPAYPAYGYHPHSSSTYVFRYSDGDDRRRHHRHHRGHHHR